MKKEKKEMREGYRCAIKDCKAEPYLQYLGNWWCEVHLKEEWQKVLNESVRI